MSDTHPVEDFLDELHSAARRLPPREARQLIAEAEAHLYDTTADLMRDGRARDRRPAPGRGPLRQRRRRWCGPNRPVRRCPSRRWPSGSFASGLRLGAIGAVLVGLSGVVAAVIRWIGGTRALVDVPPGTTLSASDCHRWAGPGASAAACRAAAISDWTARDDLLPHRASGYWARSSCWRCARTRTLARSRLVRARPRDHRHHRGDAADRRRGVDARPGRRRRRGRRRQRAMVQRRGRRPGRCRPGTRCG